MRGELGLLDEAETLAGDDPHAWCAIAESHEARERAAYAVSRALALAGTDLRVYRNAARIQRTRLGESGHHALAAAAAMLEQQPPSTTAWCALADAWRAAGDRDAAEHYLEHAKASAATCEDWCAVGELARAEAAARTTRDRIAVVKACDDAQDLERLTINLRAGVQAIASVDDAVAMVRMCEAYGEDTGAAYARGLDLARVAEDWFALFPVSRSDAEAQQCLNNATEIGNQNDLARVEHLSRWRGFRDANRETPPLLRPEQLLAWSPRTLGWDHAPSALFDELRRRIPRATIESIAGNDYGQDMPEHLAALDEYVRTGGIRHPIRWVPLEVLQLERWSEGDHIDHVSRAFACTALCIDDAGPSSATDGNESTIAVLLESALVIGEVDAAIGLFAAMANSYGDAGMRPFAELALVLAAVWRDAGDPRIPPLVARIVHDEAQLRETYTRWAPQWLLGLTNFDQRHALWRQLARAILGPSVGHDPVLTQLAARLAD